MVRRRVLVEGRVQGVSFRDRCRLEADRHGVGGWVRNLPDGRVEAVFEGDEAAVERLVAWCRDGPQAARVTGVETHDEEPGGEGPFRVTA
ncbi:MAG: acylphosphatase [Acidimicrobiia bacterium]|nr:acylphosphatase [Acidimicrobiia bacterium]